MKTIGINKGLKRMIENVALDGETVDSTLNRLIESHNQKEKLDSTKTNIAVSEETFDKLVGLKLFPTETNVSVIYRLLTEKGRID